MSETTDILAAAIDRALDQRHGKFYGRVGYLMLVLMDDPEYLRSDLTTNRLAFIRMIYSRADELQRRGFDLTFSEIETGECISIERNSSNE